MKLLFTLYVDLNGKIWPPLQEIWKKTLERPALRRFFQGGPWTPDPVLPNSSELQKNRPKSQSTFKAREEIASWWLIELRCFISTRTHTDSNWNLETSTPSSSQIIQKNYVLSQCCCLINQEWKLSLMYANIFIYILNQICEKNRHSCVICGFICVCDFKVSGQIQYPSITAKQ